jgi:catechol 2,3-dioxygenase-like lactoylglutathione lyase family enzyme
MIMIESIDHLVITVRDLVATIAFYEKYLGCRVISDPNRPTALVFGRCKINAHEMTHTFEPKAKAPAPGAADFCLVADRPLAEVIAHLKRNGVPIELGPVQRTDARGEMTSIYFRDPDENLVEISEYPR